MRIKIALLTMLAVSGCTQDALKHSTIWQARTLTDLQYRQVVDNLAMFTSNSNTLPWHVKLAGGVAQVADVRGAALERVFGGGGESKSSLTPSLSAERTVVAQWDLEPATDGDELELLQLAYQRLVTPRTQRTTGETMPATTNNADAPSEAMKDLQTAGDELDVEIRYQIWKLVNTYEFAAGSPTILAIMQDAVNERFKELAKDLEAAGVEGTLNNYDVWVPLLNARNALLDLIEMQQAANVVRVQREVLFALSKGVVDAKQLIPPWDKDNAYVSEFEESMEKVKRNLTKAADAITAIRKNQPTSSPNNKKKLGEVETEIRYMNSDSDLREDLVYLHPTKSRELPDKERWERWRKRNEILLQPVVRGTPATRPTTYSSDFQPGPFQEQVDLISDLLNRRYLIAPVKPKQLLRNPGLADQAQAKVEALKELLEGDTFRNKSWLGRGKPDKVPSNAAYIGHYKNDYVWVMPCDIRDLSKFTLIVQSLAPIEKQDVFTSRGAAFSPAAH